MLLFQNDPSHFPYDFLRKDIFFNLNTNIDDLSSNKLYKYSTQALLYYKSDLMCLIINSLKTIFDTKKLDKNINQILEIIESSFLDT